MKLAALFLLSLTPLGQAGSSGYFVPAHRVSGIGVARDGLSDELLQVRTDEMIQSQTFTIMREPLAVPGARRISDSSHLQALFRRAAERSGLSASLIEAIAYLESWGNPRAESPAGPKGIMQISSATAHSMGLRVIERTRYRVTRHRVQRTRHGRKQYVTLVHRVPYVVTLRDDRLSPDRAIPAAANYLAGMAQKFGGLDWAIFAYHCGQGCVGEMIDLTRHAQGIPKNELTVPRMFFSCSPVWNRDLYQAIQQQMQRDWSPTYYFRIVRAEQLLALYRRDPQAFEELSRQYHSDFDSVRAPHRLAVWVKRADLVFRNSADLRNDDSKLLVRAANRPEYLGYRLSLRPDSPEDVEDFALASPAALGTLTYIAFETRRLLDKLHPGEEFQPLDVTSLVEPEDGVRQSSDGLTLMHCSGQVFDIDYSALSPGELECLRFVLNDLGWAGYLGFVEEGRDQLHIGCSPNSRQFFTRVFEESLGPQGPEQMRAS